MKLEIILFKSYPELKKKLYWGYLFGVRGYFISTIVIDSEMIKRYLIHQEEEERNNMQVVNISLI